MFHTIDDSKEALDNLYHLFCFACLPFLIILIILFDLMRVCVVFSCICLVHSIPWYGGITSLVSAYILYHVDNVYWPVISDWCVNVHDELIYMLKTFEAWFLLTRELANTCCVWTTYVLIPAGIALIVSLVLREATGIPMAMWVVGMCCFLEGPYRNVSPKLETNLFHAWSVFKKRK